MKFKQTGIFNHLFGNHIERCSIAVHINRVGILRELFGQRLAIAGGVAANTPIRHALETLCRTQDVQFVAPPLRLCTDNAAMIAFAGIERFRLGHRDDATLSARPRWPLDQTAPAMIGSGKKGAKA